MKSLVLAKVPSGHGQKSIKNLEKGLRSRFKTSRRARTCPRVKKTIVEIKKANPEYGIRNKPLEMNINFLPIVMFG